MLLLLLLLLASSGALTSGNACPCIALIAATNIYTAFPASRPLFAQTPIPATPKAPRRDCYTQKKKL